MARKNTTKREKRRRTRARTRNRTEKRKTTKKKKKKKERERRERERSRTRYFSCVVKVCVWISSSVEFLLRICSSRQRDGEEEEEEKKAGRSRRDISQLGVIYSRELTTELTTGGSGFI